MPYQRVRRWRNCPFPFSYFFRKRCILSLGWAIVNLGDEERAGQVVAKMVLSREGMGGALGNYEWATTGGEGGNGQLLPPPPPFLSAQVTSDFQRRGKSSSMSSSFPSPPQSMQHGKTALREEFRVAQKKKKKEQEAQNEKKKAWSLSPFSFPFPPTSISI